MKKDASTDDLKRIVLVLQSELIQKQNLMTVYETQKANLEEKLETQKQNLMTVYETQKANLEEKLETQKGNFMTVFGLQKEKLEEKLESQKLTLEREKKDLERQKDSKIKDLKLYIQNITSRDPNRSGRALIGS